MMLVNIYAVKALPVDISAFVVTREWKQRQGINGTTVGQNQKGVLGNLTLPPISGIGVKETIRAHTLWSVGYNFCKL